MNRLEHKIPPPLVGLLCALLMWVLSTVTPVIHWWGVTAQIVTGVVVVIGLFLDSGGLVSFVRSKTTINPIKIEKASALVTGGVYRFTRNPMYLAMTALYLGFALAFDSPVMLALLLPLLALMRWGVIAREERYMAAKFGAPYAAYKARVRRWL